MKEGYEMKKLESIIDNYKKGFKPNAKNLAYEYFIFFKNQFTQL
jgi:hypothetical protein